MFETHRYSSAQSGLTCSGASPTGKRPMTSKVSGSMTATSSDSSFGTYTRSGTSATRGSSSPLIVAEYTPPAGVGLGVAATVGAGDAVASALALGVALPAVGVDGPTDGLDTGVEQADGATMPRSAIAARWPVIGARRAVNACCRCGPG